MLEQAEVDVSGLVPDLLLECRHTLHPAEWGDHGEQKRELRHHRYGGLAIDDRSVGVDSDGDQVHDHVVKVVCEVTGIWLGGERVVVGHEYVRLVLVLEADVVDPCTDIVTDMEPAGHPDPAQPTLPGRHLAQKCIGGGMGARWPDVAWPLLATDCPAP